MTDYQPWNIEAVKPLDRNGFDDHQRAFSQGARCGHIEGKCRVGAYVNGEEEELAAEAAKVNASMRTITAWASGYRYGFRLAAEGSALHPVHTNAPLPLRSKDRTFEEEE